MTAPVDFNEFSSGRAAESEVVALKEHIASDAPNVWAVHTHGMGRQFDTYQEANEYFNSLPASDRPSLMLYTRVGTAVVFRYKEP